MKFFFKKVGIAVRNPKRIISYLKKKRYRWTPDQEYQLKRKQYTSYDEYVAHQKSKFQTVEHTKLPQYDLEYRTCLRERLQKQGLVVPPMNVLCLAARMGTEVKSFLDMGCFAIGLDLEPGRENKYVVHGDFHDIQFADHSIDVIFINSLDHVFDFERLMQEIRRVLKSEGLLITEIVNGEEEGCTPGYHESMFWKKIDDVVALVTRVGFCVIKRDDFTFPWNGQHVSFRLMPPVSQK